MELLVVHFLSAFQIVVFSFYAEGYVLKWGSADAPRWRNISIHAGRGGTEDLRIYCLQGEQKTITSLWRRVSLKFNFNNDANYELFDEPTAEQVERMYRAHQKSWFHFWPLKTTEIAVCPFNDTCIGVATKDSRQLDPLIEVKVVYSPYLAATICSVMLFYYANRLSKNIAFYYGTGMTIGILASVLIVFFLLSRLVPGKKLSIVLMGAGFSTFLTAAQYLWRTQALVFLEHNYEIVFGYLVFTGLFSFALLYWYGPPSNPRSLDIVQWTIQLISLSLLYYSIQVREVGVTSIALLVVAYNFPLFIFQRVGFFWRLRFPRKRRLLTVAEYEQQADEYTRKSLEELRAYCRSPNCDPWKTISKLDTPTRFAEFVEGSSHLQDDELLRFDAGDMADVTPLTDDANSDDEIDFMLSSS
ncbi:nuclear envelope integral membrane protein-like [Watersipora subatra]|uniref:nuclear envelope integral membrane protein-like n=1 Tax=Watersipora subatra TaxID=2589382 RepID=UPI00355ADCDC